MAETSGFDEEFGRPVTASAQTFAHIRFEDGIIGKWTQFLNKRFGTGEMLGKGVGAFMVSSVLGKVHLLDQKGPLSPNIFVLDIARTGLGNKTPVIKMIREVIKAMAPDVLLAPSRLTPESIHSYIAGKEKGELHEQKQLKAKVVDEEQLFEKVKPKTHFVFLKDEISRMLADREHKSYMSGTDEILCDLWDGYLQSNYTNKRGLEDDRSVYVSLYGAGSYRFLQLLDDAFFIQGLGNRILWIDEPVTPPEVKGDFFFGALSDDEKDHLINTTVAQLRFIHDNVKSVIVSQPEYWISWVNECYRNFAKEQTEDPLGSAESEYLSKMIVHTLKLAMCYAASEFSIQPSNKQLSVSSDNIKMAVEDGKKFFKMWRSLMRKAESFSSSVRSTEQRLPTHRLDLTKMLEVGRKLGLFTKDMVKTELNTTNGKEVAEIIALGVGKGYIKELTETTERGEVVLGGLSEDEWKKFKPRRGPVPQVFRITDSGKSHLEEST